MNVVNRGIFSGYTATTFCPEETLTNAALPYVVGKIVGGTGINAASVLPPGFVSDDDLLHREAALYTFAKLKNLSLPTSSAAILSSFADSNQVTAGYENQVAAAVQAGYCKGNYDSGSLMLYPQGYVTRAEIAVLTDAVLPANVEGQIFFDVAPSDWYYDGVMNLYNRGIIKGYPDGTFKPDNQLGTGLAYLAAKDYDSVNDPPADPTTGAAINAYYPNHVYSETRETTAYVLLKMLDIDVSNVNADDILDNFTDQAAIDPACRKSIAYLVSIGAMNGDQDGKIDPKGGPLTRAEFAVFYARLLNGLDESKMHDYQTTINAVKTDN